MLMLLKDVKIKWGQVKNKDITKDFWLSIHCQKIIQLLQDVCFIV